MSSILITAVGGPAGNAAVVSLKNDYKIVATDMDRYAPALHYSGLTPRIIPVASDPDYISYLIGICQELKVDMVLPCSDEEILILSQNHEVFAENGIILPIPRYEQIIKVSDKYSIQKLAEKGRLNSPKTILIDSEQDIEALINEFEFPCVLKPRLSRGARGIKYCNDLNQLIYHYKQSAALFDNKFTIQEYVPGRQGSVLVNQTMWDANSEVVASAVLRKLKEKPTTGGVALAGETIYDDKILDMTASLFDEIGEWVGPAGVEYKIHEKTGEPYLMEVNPRLQGITLGFYPSLDFPKMWVEIGFNKTTEKKMKYPEGLVFIRSWEDKVFNKKELFYHK